ncbi:MAG: hypothetical protein RL769_42 [Pseudomonadota bacterium]|jgi:quinolinate synthase
MKFPENLEQEILKLKNQLNAVILAHYYQDPEIQDIADFVGDSLDLSRKASNTDAKTIVFCGVKFMAEVAKILSPQKTVLIPDFKAGCSLEDSCQPEDFAKFKAKYPDALVISYINCSAQIKALSDIIVTSTNAQKIVEQIPSNQRIIFAPDQHLGRYIAKQTNRDLILWQGSCIVHEQFSEKELVKLITNHPDAFVIAHPECPQELLKYADHIGSTSSLLNFVKRQGELLKNNSFHLSSIESGIINDSKNNFTKTKSQKFIVLTEPHIIHQMKKINPTAQFIDCPFINQAGCTLCNTCPYMALNTLEKLYLVMFNHVNKLNNNQKNSDPHSLVNFSGGELELEENLRVKAELPLRKMLAMS